MVRGKIYPAIAGSSNLPRQIMVNLYILKNDKNKYYVGITSIVLEERIQKHNKGDVRSTKKGRPWKLIYSEAYNDFKSARVREVKVKSWHGGNAFKKLVAGAVGSSNGRTTDSGSVYLGSNPSPTAPVISKFGGLVPPRRDE